MYVSIKVLPGIGIGNACLAAQIYMVHVPLISPCNTKVSHVDQGNISTKR